MTRHILVVDDDTGVREVIVDMLTIAGFTVTEASGGEEMRDALAPGSNPVDAIVLDALMPGEPSATLALHAKSLRIPVVMISGDHNALTLAERDGLFFVRKPFAMADLLRAVDSAIVSDLFGQRDA